MTDETVTAVVLLFRNLSNTCLKKHSFRRLLKGREILLLKPKKKLKKITLVRYLLLSLLLSNVY